MNKKIVALAISALFVSSTAMAETVNSTLTVTGALGTATCNVQLPSGSLSVPTLSDSDINSKSTWQKITEIDAGNITVSNCSGKTLQLTVDATGGAKSGTYLYPMLANMNQQQRDFAFHMTVGESGASLGAQQEISSENGNIPVKLSLIKLSGNYNKQYSGGTYSVPYTFNVTYN